MLNHTEVKLVKVGSLDALKTAIVLAEKGELK